MNDRIAEPEERKSATLSFREPAISRESCKEAIGI